MKKAYTAALSAFMILLPPRAMAAEAAPETGLARISWAMRNSGPMNRGMIMGLTAIAGMIIITVLYAKFTAREDKKDE